MPIVTHKIGSQEQIVAKNVINTGCTTENLSRHDLLGWVNEILAACYMKIEELANGGAYCQMMHMLFPKSISLKKVKFQTVLEHEMRQNFVIFQLALSKVGIEKQIQIDRLIKGRFQDNFEFLQWFKKFFDNNYNGHEYDALQARGNVHLGSGKVVAQKKKVIVPKKIALDPGNKENQKTSITSTPKPLNEFDGQNQLNCNLSTVPPSEVTTTTTTTNSDLNDSTAEMYEDLLEQKQSLEEAIKIVDVEKTYYFSKIQNIEICCGSVDENGNEQGFAAKVLGILHSAE